MLVHSPSQFSIPACSRPAGQVLKCPTTDFSRRRYRSGLSCPSSGALALPSAAVYELAADAIRPEIQSSSGASAGHDISVLQALLERAQLEAQQRASGGAAPPTTVDTAAADAILNRIPGKDALISGAAEVMRATDSATSSLQVLLRETQSSSAAQGGEGLNLRQLLDSNDERLKGAFEGLVAAPTALQQKLSSFQGLAPEEGLAGLQADLNEAAQVVGAAVLPGNSPGSIELLESRRAAGHLLDLTPVYRAWATLVQPFDIFGGDRWLLNIMFLGVFALLGFTLLTKAPRQ